MATLAALSTAAAATLGLFCLCLNVGLCVTTAPVVVAATKNSTKVVRLQLIPRDSPLAATSNTSKALFLRSLTESDRVRLAILRSHAWVAAMENKVPAQGYEAPLSLVQGSYLLELTIGSPALRYKAMMDTGSDLIWTQCQPCESCFDQITPIFDPSTSTTYQTCAFNSAACRWLPPKHSGKDRNSQCRYRYAYFDGSSTKGLLAIEVFTLSSVPFINVAFGCGTINAGLGFGEAGGMVGFGRGPLSLPSQFARSVGSHGVAFAYCLAFGTTTSSPLWLGPDAPSNFPGNLDTAPSTRLIMNPIMGTHYYYVSVTGIDIDGLSVDIPSGAFDLGSDGKGGLVLDSGTAMTLLEFRTYTNFMNALKSAISFTPVDGSSGELELCYNASEVNHSNFNFPPVTLTFEGGAKMEWVPRNYLGQMNDLLCVTVLPTARVSVIGNIAQKNFFILHDTSVNKIFFTRAECDSL